MTAVSQETVIDHAQQVWTREAEFIEEHRGDLIRLTRAPEDRVDLAAMRARISAIEHRDSPDYDNRVRQSEPSFGARLLNFAIRGLEQNKRDEVATRISTLVNNFFLPMNSISLPTVEAVQAVTTFKGREVACSAAEGFFISTSKQIETGEDYLQRDINVYKDSSDRSLILQKSVEDATGITLVPFIIRGTILPAGYIVDVNSVMQSVNQRCGTIETKHTVMSTYTINGAPDIYPLRLSGLAHDNPLDRAMYALRGRDTKDSNPLLLEFYPDKAKTLQAHTLDDCIQAAHRVVEMCTKTK